jgi:hypothetical protein
MFTVRVEVHGEPHDVQFPSGTRVDVVVNKLRSMCGLLVGGVILDKSLKEVETDIISNNEVYFFDAYLLSESKLLLKQNLIFLNLLLNKDCFIFCFIF